MPLVLVVDDSPLDRRRAAGLLENRLHIQTASAGNGLEAIDAIEQCMPDVVLTDMQMPEMDGLELVRQVRARHASLPIILMTAVGSEEIAAEALRAGAAGYVPKRYLTRDLVGMVERTVKLARGGSDDDRLLQCLVSSELRFELPSDPKIVQPFLQHLRYDLERHGDFEENEMMRVRVALDEAIRNAIEHGNLEIDTTLRGLDDSDLAALVAERTSSPPWSARKVSVVARITPERMEFIVRDEGRGFDASTLPTPDDSSCFDSASGRGIMLMRSFMDEVHHNNTGNQVTLLKHRPPRGMRNGDSRPADTNGQSL